MGRFRRLSRCTVCNSSATIDAQARMFGSDPKPKKKESVHGTHSVAEPQPNYKSLQSGTGTAKSGKPKWTLSQRIPAQRYFSSLRNSAYSAPLRLKKKRLQPQRRRVRRVSQRRNFLIRFLSSRNRKPGKLSAAEAATKPCYRPQRQGRHATPHKFSRNRNRPPTIPKHSRDSVKCRGGIAYSSFSTPTALTEIPKPPLPCPPAK
uniref:Uncharacterized protein n=1 Tax=Candidatus Kentrum sp. DK TaxID=2126562 RepID=A0A450RZG1_9GAMM|nr:MAG: hypothetical protein BECKDK2373C_GA0170839_100923 [Candidatus Kentron sp. DK]VFJ44878.1 MAG: hypothetical protein BECKDK2373B_GA0170837_100833 [Candidatus Kentron sp. DK]